MAARRGRGALLPVAAEGDEDPYAAAIAAAAAAAAREDQEIYGPNLNHVDIPQEIDEEKKDAINTKNLLANPSRVDKNEYYRYRVTPPELLRRTRMRDEVTTLYETLPANARKRRHLLSMELMGQSASAEASSLRTEIANEMQVIRDCPTEMERLNKGKAVVKVKAYLLRQPALLPKIEIGKGKKKKH